MKLPSDARLLIVRLRALVFIALAIGMATLLGLVAWPDDLPTGAVHRPVTSAISVAVIGDSGSQSYQDKITFPPGSGERGGALRERTFQWTEVLVRLRGTEVDLGPWVRWGRPGLVAWLRDLIGLGGGRAPEKEDYLYNFANSGASCKHIMGERFGQRYRQVPRLLALMNEDPERWRGGVVVIAMGTNDWNGLLDVQARNPTAPEIRAAVDYCREQIELAIETIHAVHPSTRVLVVGGGNQADDPSTFNGYRSISATANINHAVDEFDDALRSIAARDPKRVGFVDFGAWFTQRWGARRLNGVPAYRRVSIGSLQVSNTSGDGLENAWLSDGHAGTAMNALWAQYLIGRLREISGAQLTPISDEEVIRFVVGDEAPSRP